MEELTPEEKVIVGDVEPESSTADQAKPLAEGEKPPAGGEKPLAEGEKPAGEQPEHTEEEKAAAEKQGFRIEGKFLIDDEGTKIPLTRWRKFYGQAKEVERGQAETQRKLNLFKELGPDKFYGLYPEEKPAGYKPAATRGGDEIPEANIGAMVVQGGPYDGKTLNEVYQEDPAYATLLQNQYLDGRREKATTVQRQQEEIRRESETEISAFTDQLSTELFGKKTTELSKDEEAKVVATIQNTLDWMAKTRRGAGIIADAYFLMNREGILRTAHESGGKAALASLQKPPIASIDTTGGKTTVTDFEAMTADQLAKAIENMPDKKAMEFLKNAPAAVKAKHPQLPWE